VYHIPVKRESPGVTAASKNPRKNRLTIAVVKLVQAIMDITQLHRRRRIGGKIESVGRGRESRESVVEGVTMKGSTIREK